MVALPGELQAMSHGQLASVCVRAEGQVCLRNSRKPMNEAKTLKVSKRGSGGGGPMGRPSVGKGSSFPVRDLVFRLDCNSESLRYSK